jgi:CheY-like chemotaxis protein
MNVLLVEDDPRIAQVVERVLTDVGHCVDLAYDGLDGLTSAQLGTRDLLLLDVMLPTMDGMEIARELRRQRVRTPILMLTTRDAVPDRVRGLDSGADDYLTEPFALEELGIGRAKSAGQVPASTWLSSVGRGQPVRRVVLESPNFRRCKRTAGGQDGGDQGQRLRRGRTDDERHRHA